MKEEARTAIDLIFNAPDNVAKGYLTSILASKTISSISERCKSIAEEKEEDRPKEEKEEASKEADKEDIALDPEMTKEYYLKSFEYKGKVVTLKKLGMGASAPVSAYVDDKRTEIFLSAEQAEREIKKIIDLKEKSKPATVESLTLTGKDGLIVEHDDGSTTNMTFEDTKMALEIHKRLNNTNREKFEKTFAASNEKALQMIQYFQERLKRDLV
jgi:hypothetical protein